jgi:methionine aminopeptidase, type II
MTVGNSMENDNIEDLEEEDGEDHEHEHEELDEEEEKGLRDEVGMFSFKALQKAREMVKEGVKLIEVADSIENYARENGFDIAFPLNLSVGKEAAHYTPTLSDEKIFLSSDVVKVDFGVGKKGVLGDCATTVDLSGNYQKLLEATENALNAAISTVRAGTMVKDIGKVISKTISDMGLLPIRNLGGHGVKVHDLHSEPFIPNFDNGDTTVLEEGDVIAIEPFASHNGRGFVGNSDIVEIYSIRYPVQTRSSGSRAMLNKIIEMGWTEPFALRWFGDAIGSKFELYAAVRELERAGAVEGHPMLIELGDGIVSQHEAEVEVEKGGCKVLTK